MARCARHLVGFVCLLVALPSFATTYYVSSQNGNDANDGRSPSSAWQTLNAVNTRVNGLGDDVRLESGSVFENQTLYIGWDGSQSNRVVVDCYKVGPGGSALDCATWDAKPEINGTFDEACVATKSCVLDTWSAVPSTSWDALVTIMASHVTFRQVAVHDTAGLPVLVGGTRTRSVENFLVEDLDIERTARFVVLVNFGSYNGTVRRVEGRLYNLCDRDKLEPCSYPGWPGGIMVADARPSHVLLEDNYVHQGYGEGINCMRSTHVVIRGNRVGNVHSNGIYLDHCGHAIVENNIAWGDIHYEWNELGGFAGIALGAEDYHSGADTDNVVIRNNLVTGYAACIWASQWEQSREAGYKMGFHAYGNTCTAQLNEAINIEYSIAHDNITEIVVENNIFHNDLSNSICKSINSSKVRMDHNFWPSGVLPAACSGPNDQHGDPQLAASLAEFRQMDTQTQPYASHFRILESSPAIQGGKDVSNLLLVSAGEFTAAQLNASKGCEYEENALAQDFHCVSRQSPPSMGAVDRAQYPPRPPVIIAAQ